MEDKKLIADVKTATGRHRFTRKNITDFLYPDGGVSPLILGESNKDRSTQIVTSSPLTTKLQEEVVEETKEEKEEEQVDWLAKFREAATKYKEEQDVQKTQEEMPGETPQPQPQPEPQPVEQEPQPQPQPVSQPVQSVPYPVPPIPQPVPQPVSQPTPPPAPQPQQQQTPSLMYYRSMLGGLKEIAQNLDKSARNSNLDYAFTLNAGASLHKPIKPFATLHAYVKSTDRDFFEKILRLTPSNQSTAQLCLVVSDDTSIYSNRTEVHGLYVVSKDQLKRDISTFGEAQLAQEMADVL